MRRKSKNIFKFKRKDEINAHTEKRPFTESLILKSGRKNPKP